MFKRHKLRENALELLSLCGAVYPKQDGISKQAELVTAMDALTMLGPMSVGCVCKTNDSLHKWVESNIR